MALMHNKLCNRFKTVLSKKLFAIFLIFLLTIFVVSSIAMKNNISLHEIKNLRKTYESIISFSKNYEMTKPQLRNFENMMKVWKHDESEINVTKISSWYMIINEPGYYELTQDIMNCTCQVGIYINASNVILDGKGHILDGKRNSNDASSSIYGIYINNKNNITIKNIIINDWNTAGIYIFTASNIYIYNVTVQNSKNGIISAGGWPLSSTSINISIYDSIIQNNRIGIHFTCIVNAKIYHNVIRNNRDGGIWIYESPNVEIQYNIICDNYDGIALTDTLGIKIYKNVLQNNNHYEILSWCSSSIDISNNFMKNSSFGIFLYKSPWTGIYNNTIVDCRNYLIYSKGSSKIKVCFNILQNSYYGVRIICSSNSEIRGNLIQNSEYGLYLGDVKNSIITENTIQNNSYGIWLAWSDGNIIYLNNFIDNTEQYYIYKSHSQFYSAEPIMYAYGNKVYANYTGNYWSDYQGADTNNDGIGNSPYGPDKYPLVGKVGETIKIIGTTFIPLLTNVIIFIVSLVLIVFVILVVRKKKLSVK